MEPTKNTFQEEKGPGLFGSRAAESVLWRAVLFLSLICFAVSPLSAQESQLSAEERIIAERIFGPIETRTVEPEVKEGGQTKTFEHKLTLYPYAGLPSEIAFAGLDQKPEEVRVFFVLDDRLLVVPLRRGASANRFRGVFPTPKKTLRYQFQLTFFGGSTVLSEVFVANPRCPTTEAQKSIQKAKAFPAQAKLLDEAIETEKEILVFEYIVNSVDHIVRHLAKSKQ